MSRLRLVQEQPLPELTFRTGGHPASCCVPLCPAGQYDFSGHHLGEEDEDLNKDDAGE